MSWCRGATTGEPARVIKVFCKTLIRLFYKNATAWGAIWSLITEGSQRWTDGIGAKAHQPSAIGIRPAWHVTPVCQLSTRQLEKMVCYME